MTSDVTKTPGSDVARRAGCSCNAITNQYGKGAGETTSGKPIFVVARDCKLHGGK